MHSELPPRMSYEEYIHSDHWSDLRLRAFARAGRKCESCQKMEKVLHGHHLQYRNFIDCTEDDVMALCERCHKLWHHYHSSHVITDRQTVLLFLEEARKNPPLAIRGFDKKPSRQKKQRKQPRQPKKKKERSAQWHLKHDDKVARRKQNKPIRKAWCDLNRQVMTKETLGIFIDRMTAVYSRL